MSRGIDYAWTHPPVSLIKSAGYAWVARYLSHDATKNITKGEAAELLAAGLGIVTCWEYGAQDMLRGHAGGVSDATGAVIQLAEAGLAGAFVYFAADWDTTPGQQALINEYLAGAASVLGLDRTGIYGGYYSTERALNAGVASKAWQTFAWSGGQWDSRDAIHQGVTVRLAGVSVDLDDSMVADFGQWPRPSSPVPPPPAPAPSATRFVADGTRTLHGIARDRNTTVDHLAAVSYANLNPANAAVLHAYLALCDAALAAGLNLPLMPDGLVYWAGH